MTTLLNGVDVPKVMAEIEAVRKNPAEGTFTFRVNSQWAGGVAGTHASGDLTLGSDQIHRKSRHQFKTDLPDCFAGTDDGMSPVEMLLASLSACLLSSYAIHASAMNIKLQELFVDVRGEGDIAGFFGIGNAKPGLTEVSVRATMKSTAPPERLQDLHRFVTTHSVIWDTLAGRVHIEGKLITDADDSGVIEL